MRNLSGIFERVFAHNMPAQRKEVVATVIYLHDLYDWAHVVDQFQIDKSSRGARIELLTHIWAWILSNKSMAQNAVRPFNTSPQNDNLP